MTNFNVRRALLCAACSSLLAVAGQAPAMSVLVQDLPATDAGDTPPPVGVVPIVGGTSVIAPPLSDVVPIVGGTSLLPGGAGGPVAAVPEPSTPLLSLTGLLLMAGVRLWRQRGGISPSCR